SAPLLRAIGAARRDPPLETLCYRVLSAVASGEACVDRLLVRQLPYDAARPLPAAVSDARAAVIMPHRGNIRHLETALRYLGKSTGMPLSVRVGLDVERPAVYRSLAGAPAEFYAAHPAGCGPYVIRQALINRSLEAALVWQDSDDIPCADRFVTLWSEIESSGCDLAGSHELRLNELSERVEARRFPLDASAALESGPGYTMSPVTTMLRRSAFHRAGGLSTDQRIANDTQFLLRASFHMRLRNVDAFVYIRRRHAESLTESPATGKRAPLRRQLGQAWSADFRAVKAGALRLQDSSLRPIAGTRHYRIERFPADIPVLPQGRWRSRFARLIRGSPSARATIIVPVMGQQSAWLEQCLDSVLHQTAAVEVIAVAGAAVPAAHLAVLRRLAAHSPALRAIPCEPPESLPGAINTGIRAASTGRIGFLAGGGWIDPDTVARCLSQSADIVSTGSAAHDATGNVCLEAGRVPSPAGYQACPTLSAKAGYLQPFFLVRRERLLEAGGFDETIGDLEIAGFDLVWTLLELGASVALVEAPLYHFRTEGERRNLVSPAILRKHRVTGEEAQELTAHTREARRMSRANASGGERV
ncbi:MAG TPA: glycosyltransferase, partial [Bryobacteraceae bacterium]|nr:glycosyltransferase [Bryobacteraceae bacterium]